MDAHEYISYTDPLFFFYELFPSIVASETHDKIPVVGTIIRTTQVCFACIIIRTKYSRNFLCKFVTIFLFRSHHLDINFFDFFFFCFFWDQVIYVDRSSPESRKHAVAEIKVIDADYLLFARKL
jgi:1-acyl-sn-glycerol-3-phosphate acyltransferase